MPGLLGGRRCAWSGFSKPTLLGTRRSTRKISKLDAQITQSLRPVDEYFDQVAIPHIGDFLADFSGVFYDTPRFAYKWLADKTGFRGNSNRVQTQVKASLAEHLGFPDQFNASVRGSIERFHALQQQQDAELREKAYAVLHGAGVSVDKQALIHC